jgi:hypothetical protein
LFVVLLSTWRYKSKNTDYLSQAAAASVVLKELADALSKPNSTEDFKMEIIDSRETILQVLAAGNQHPPLEDTLKNSRNLAGNSPLHPFFLAPPFVSPSLQGSFYFITFHKSSFSAMCLHQTS